MGSRPFTFVGTTRKYERDRPFSIARLVADLALDVDRSAVRGVATLDVVRVARDEHRLKLDAVAFEIESVTVSGNQVSVNGTLYGTYSFANQDLVFTFGSGNSNPDIIGAIMDAVAYQNTAFPRGASGSFGAENETVPWTFNSSAGTTLAPSDSISVASYYPGAVNIVDGGRTSSSVTTYAGTPVVLAPTAEFQILQGIASTGGPYIPELAGMNVSIVSGGGQLGFNAVTTPEYTVTHDATNPDLWRVYSGSVETDVSIVSSSQIDVFAASLSLLNDPGVVAFIADNITYENTSSNAPSRLRSSSNLAA